MRSYAACADFEPWVEGVSLCSKAGGSVLASAAWLGLGGAASFLTGMAGATGGGGAVGMGGWMGGMGPAKDDVMRPVINITMYNNLDRVETMIDAAGANQQNSAASAGRWQMNTGTGANQNMPAASVPFRRTGWNRRQQRP